MEKIDYKDQVCLVVNRGEIACRIFDSCKKLGIKTIAVAALDEEEARHANLADEKVLLEGETLESTYLNQQLLMDIAKEKNVTLVHPGYGFLAENAEFAGLVKDSGFTWVGPNKEAILNMGSKIVSKQIAIDAGVPVLPWAKFKKESDEEIIKIADEVGYPLLVKASGGGGGKGMRLVESKDRLLEAIDLASSEAAASFNDPTVFLERYVEFPRHIEVQVFGDNHGNAVHLFDRECSAQRRHQKIIEEAPALNLPDDVRQRMHESAVLLTKHIKYEGAGTVEYIFDGKDIFFLEMNTRLQVEHPVTEMITNLDLVELQLNIALGQELPFEQQDIEKSGHAIECRIYAEDPSFQFMPSPGPIQKLDWPMCRNVRIDTGVLEGQIVSTKYDPMIAKVTSFEQDKESAVVTMVHALSELTLLGFPHNVSFLKKLLAEPCFRESTLTTNWIEKNLSEILGKENLTDDQILNFAASALQLKKHQKKSSHPLENGIKAQVSLFEEIKL